jgi:hypothetical protein
MKRLRWHLKQSEGLFEVKNQDNEQKTAIETSYDFAPYISSDGGNSFVLNYELNNLQSATLTAWKTIGWRYLSPTSTSEGTNTWEAELGYTYRILTTSFTTPKQLQNSLTYLAPRWSF